jgi:hypothetical protein
MMEWMIQAAKLGNLIEIWHLARRDKVGNHKND